MAIKSTIGNTTAAQKKQAHVSSGDERQPTNYDTKVYYNTRSPNSPYTGDLYKATAHPGNSTATSAGGAAAVGGSSVPGGSGQKGYDPAAVGAAYDGSIPEILGLVQNSSLSSGNGGTGYDPTIFYSNIPTGGNSSDALLRMAQGNTAEQNALAREYRKGSTPRWQELFDNSQKSYWDDNIGALYGIKAQGAGNDALGTMAADNGGNIDSYAAANANQQYLSYLDKGINAMINQANAQQANGYNALTGWGNTNANVISALGESLSPLMSGFSNAYATEGQNLANTYDYLNQANQTANDYYTALLNSGDPNQDIIKWLDAWNNEGDLSEFAAYPKELIDTYLKENSGADPTRATNVITNYLNNKYRGTGAALTINDIINGNTSKGESGITDAKSYEDALTRLQNWISGSSGEQKQRYQSMLDALLRWGSEQTRGGGGGVNIMK